MSDSSADRLAVDVSEIDHSAGPADAAITLVEYGDYECPHCGKAYPIVKALRQILGDRLRYVFRNFPLITIHRHASVAAQAAEAAAAQGKFWDMHNMLYEHQDELAETGLTKWAVKIGLELYRFGADLSSERFAPRVKADYDGGVKSGVKGTPAFFINGERYRGGLSTPELLAAIQSAEGK
jgi:protein-disulfide isomerase